MAFLRLLLLLLAVQTVVYVSVLLYLRAARREMLERSYPEQASPREKEAFVSAQVRAYAGRVAPRLAALVYITPIAVLAAVIYANNFG